MSKFYFFPQNPYFEGLTQKKVFPFIKIMAIF